MVELTFDLPDLCAIHHVPVPARIPVPAPVSYSGHICEDAIYCLCCCGCEAEVAVKYL